MAVSISRLFCSFVAAILVVYLPTHIQAQWMLQSQNYQDLKISFNTTEAGFPVNLDNRGRRFILHQPGLNGRVNSISFESIDFPGRFLRHSSYSIYAHIFDGSDLFKDDATFVVHTNRNFQGYYSFESSNLESYYLRHRYSYLEISNDQNEYWAGDISYRFLQKNIMLQPRTQSGCEVSHCKISKGNGDQVYVEDKGQVFHMVSPALNGQKSSVSFEDALRPGYYLRDYAQYTYIDFSNNTRSPFTYIQDASFYLRYNKFSSGFYGIESAKYPGRFLRAVDKFIKISPQDGSTGYATEASFRIAEGPVYLESQNKEGHKIAINGDNKAVMSQSGSRWNIVYPGLTGNPATLSIESFDKPGYYLRHFEFDLDLEDWSSPRNPGIFASDASFIVRKNLWFLDYIVMESVNYRNQCIRHDDNKLRIAAYESDSDTYTGDVSYKITEAPLDAVPGPDTGSGANVGAIVGGIFGILLLVLLIVGAIFLDKKLAWTDTVRRKLQGTSSDTAGGVDNPTYPATGVDEEQPKDTSASGPKNPPKLQSAKPRKPESTSSVTSSPPITPTTPTSDPFVDTGTTQSTNPVKRLGRRLSDSMSKLRRSSSTKSNDDRRMEMPESFDLSVQDFQPGYDTQPSNNGSFDNPMYGLKKLSHSDSTDGESGYQSPLDISRGSTIQRHDSIIEASPTLTAVPSDFDQAMSFYDQAIEGHDTQEVDLGDIGGSKEAAPNDPVYATVDKSKKRLSAGITPITEDDLWE